MLSKSFNNHVLEISTNTKMAIIITVEYILVLVFPELLMILLAFPWLVPYTDNFPTLNNPLLVQTAKMFIQIKIEKKKHHILDKRISVRPLSVRNTQGTPPEN